MYVFYIGCSIYFGQYFSVVHDLLHILYLWDEQPCTIVISVPAYIASVPYKNNILHTFHLFLLSKHDIYAIINKALYSFDTLVFAYNADCMVAMRN
jgi:hypothetical protein